MTDFSSLTEAMLSSSQRAFLSDFIGPTPRRARLVSRPGGGKSSMAALAARGLLLGGLVQHVSVVTSHLGFRSFWHEALGAMFPQDGGAWSVLSANEFVDLQSKRHGADHDVATLTVIEELHATSDDLEESLSRLLAANARNRALGLTGVPGLERLRPGRSWETDYFLDSPMFRAEGVRAEILRYAPAYGVLDSLQFRQASVDGLHWRQFEKLVQELLEARGYQVQLMRGSKDGGVDVVALIDQGPLGRFKTLWQAKKMGPGGKVGLSTARELADTRLEFGASKAYVITSAYLTKGAIQRIQRDQFVLGKVDRGDLALWIDDVLRTRHGPSSR